MLIADAATHVLVWVLSLAPVSGPHVMLAATCRYAERSFNLLVTSPSGEEAEQDQTLSIRDGEQSLVINPSPDGFMAARLSAGKSLCDRVPGLPTGDGRVMLVLAHDERPHCARPWVVLYDPARHQVTSPQLEEPSCREALQIQPERGGFAYIALRSYEGDAVGVEAWRHVKVTGGKLTSRWGRPVPRPKR